MFSDDYIWISMYGTSRLLDKTLRRHVHISYSPKRFESLTARALQSLSEGVDLLRAGQWPRRRH